MYDFFSVITTKKIDLYPRPKNEITMDTGTTTTADIYSKATYPLKYHVESLNREAA